MEKALFAIGLIGAMAAGVASAQTAKYGETSEGGDYESYISQDGTQYRIGDALKVGSPFGGNQAFVHVLEKSGRPCPSYCSGLEYEIIGFRAAGSGQGYQMWSRLKPVAGGRATVTVNFESALGTGELIGRGYTSDQALAELRKWKDKLDLELITKDEYEAKKEELSKYIH